MSSIRQIEANRRNAQLSTGPVTEEGKRKSRQNAVRHGLTAETVIDALEDAEDYASFQMAVTSDYDAQTAVERELVLRLASLLWRLRRATVIETGLFRLQARQLLQFQNRRRVRRERPEIVNGTCQSAVASADSVGKAQDERPRGGQEGFVEFANQFDGITNSFLRLSNLPTYPLDRLSRYEAALWRQACQILFILQCLNRRKPWERLRAR
jgi:hypothetical protein